MKRPSASGAYLSIEADRCAGSPYFQTGERAGVTPVPHFSGPWQLFPNSEPTRYRQGQSHAPLVSTSPDFSKMLNEGELRKYR